MKQSWHQIILLNGASSSGKSSIARELQAQLPIPFLHMSIDHLRESGVLPLVRIRSGEFVWSDMREKFFTGFELAIAAMANAGNHLIFEYIIETDEWMERLKTALNGVDVFLVGVHCPLPELQRREVARGDRPIGDAQQDFRAVHKHCTYDLEIDASLPPATNASTIINAMQA